MTNEDKMAQLIAEKDHIIGFLISLLEDARERFDELEKELDEAQRMRRYWFQEWKRLKGGDEDE